MDINLTDKKAIVAGGGGAIGYAIAQVLAETGAAVTVFDLELQALVDHKDMSGKIVDLTIVDDVRTAVDEVAGDNGLDIVVNAAGINPAKPVSEVTEEDWDAVLGVNLKSCFFLAQAAQPHFCHRFGGSIVFVSSCSAALSYPGLTTYAASKAGVEGLVRNLACDLAPDNVRVNAVAPGTTRTPMTKALWGNAKKCTAHEATIPLRRLGLVSDTAFAVLFLVSDLASYITGTVLPVDGGLTAMQQDFVDLKLRG